MTDIPVSWQNADLALLGYLRQPMGQWVQVPRVESDRFRRLVAHGLAEQQTPSRHGVLVDRKVRGRITDLGRDLLLGWLPLDATVPRGTPEPFSLTRRQKDCYEIVRRTIRNRGEAPSVRELMVMLGLRSTSGVVRVLRELEDRGWIQRLPGKCRAIRLIKEIDDSDRRVTP